MTPPRLLALLLACGGLAVLALHMSQAWPFTVDDSYITLRYSRHLAEGFGATFNHSGARAEGYTSVAWMVVLALPHLLGLPALAVAKALGVAAVLATTAIVATWLRAVTRDRASAPLAAAAAVAAYTMLGRSAVHAVSGMETAFYTGVLTALFYASTRTIEAPSAARAWQLAVTGLLCGLARPEGHLAAAVVLLMVTIGVPAPARRAVIVAAALGWAVPVLVHEAWRLAYYGLPWPLPFYVKVSSPGGLAGVAPVTGWLLETALRVGVPVIVAIAAWPPLLRPALAAAAALVLFLLVPEHLNGYEFRYLAPLDPLLCVLFGIGLGRVLSSLPTARPRLAAAVGLTALATVVAAAQAPAAIRNRLGYAEGMAAAHEPLGRDLAALGAGRLAVSDAGAIPYLSDWWTLDLVGLNDAEIAVTGNRTPAHVLAAAPDVIVLVSGSGERFETVDWNPWEGPLYDAALARGYACVSVRRFDVDYWLWVLAPSASPAGLALARRATASTPAAPASSSPARMHMPAPAASARCTPTP